MSTEPPTNHHSLSDTESMEDEEEDSDGEVFFIPAAGRPTLNRIHDTEELIVDDDTNRASSEEDSDEVDDDDRSEEIQSSHSNDDRSGIVQPRYHRIYLPDSEEIPSSEDPDDPRIPWENEPPRARVVVSDSEEEEGRVDTDEAMRSDEAQYDSDSIPDDDARSAVDEGLRLLLPPPGLLPLPAEALLQEAVVPSIRPVSTGVQDALEPAAPSTSGKKEPKKASEEPTSESYDETQCCSICFEMWTNAGDHRIVSLKCGHLFGKTCIDRWLKPHGGSRKCPQCNAKASRRDIRVIYAKALKVEDKTEQESLALEIQRLKRAKEHDEREKAQQKLKISLDSHLIKKLQDELRMLKESVKNSPSQNYLDCQSGSTSARRGKLAYFQSFDLIKNGSSRVMAYNEWMNMLAVSIPSQLEMFPGFGVKKINTLTFKMDNYVTLHSKQIRDLSFNPLRHDLLLSVGLDKVAKVTNISSSATAVSYTTNYHLWSCCWNPRNSTQFYAGTANGLVYYFDTVKNTGEPTDTYQVQGNGPVVSLSYVTLQNQYGADVCGLLVTRLNSISFCQLVDGQIKDQKLAIEGSFSHATYDQATKHFLLTCRPTDKHLHARHILHELKVLNINYVPGETSDVVVAPEIHCFKGTTTMKFLSRTCLSDNMDGKTVVIFCEESTNTVKVYDVSSGSQIQFLKTSQNIIDIVPVKVDRSYYVAMLSEKNVKFYKWIEQM